MPKIIHREKETQICTKNMTKGIDILETVLKAHFHMKGSHMQVNFVDNRTLRDAQKHPENYRNMLVRVAGYSAFFVDLEENIQENIIERTIQTGL